VICRRGSGVIKSVENVKKDEFGSGAIRFERGIEVNAEFGKQGKKGSQLRSSVQQTDDAPSCPHSRQLKLLFAGS